MIAKRGTISGSAPSAISSKSIKGTSENCKAFDPSKLPSQELDQLHQIALRQGKSELTKTIENEVFKREEMSVAIRDLTQGNEDYSEL